jgi:hypothetical protein
MRRGRRGTDMDLRAPGHEIWITLAPRGVVIVPE